MGSEASDAFKFEQKCEVSIKYVFNWDGTNNYIYRERIKGLNFFFIYKGLFYFFVSFSDFNADISLTVSYIE